MKLSTDRILTTHVGSLPRPQEVVDFLFAQDRGEPYDAAEFDKAIRSGVLDALRSQVEAGVDVVSDGEMGKISYATYIRHRLTGFEGDSARPTPQDLEDFPGYRDQLVKAGASAKYQRPVCKGPITVKDLEPLKHDVARMKDGLAQVNATEGFMNAVSPGTIAVFQPNEYYPIARRLHGSAGRCDALGIRDDRQFRFATASGLPGFGHGTPQPVPGYDGRRVFAGRAVQVEALNHALANVPADRVRMHVCWGNYQGPHTHDLPLAKILPVVLKAKPMALLLEGANPRHEHEWEIWATQKLPDDKVLIPGIIASSQNYIEHPELISQRIIRYANLVGRERVMAGSDCGFGTFAGFGPVFPAFCWLKLGALAEGAKLASAKLWGKSTLAA